ncbi:WD repeat-containing protein 76 isoform X2 [Tripterygium wilfordii]|uniref:WD repeat-containing protein 76 isoform X2 n=1 Tax=Tripterygium wilfordii TaxID=458696 RepID=UPI0018F82DE3|nr:WD repeat-containing protein 76 isoform X2 [Tripterygium wilfordii]
MASLELTEYERKRLENIRRNEEMMNAFKINSKAAELSAATKRQRMGSKSYKVSPEKKPKTGSPVIIRRSLRTRGIPPDAKGLGEGFVEPPNGGIPPDAKGLGDGFVEPSNGTPKPKRLYRPSPCVLGPISMSDAFRGKGTDRVLIDLVLDVAKRQQLSVQHKAEDHVLGKGEAVEDEKDLLKFASVKGEVDRDKVMEDEKDMLESASIKEEFDIDNSLMHEKYLVKGGCKSEPLDWPVKVEKCEIESGLDLGSLVLKPENVARVVPGRIMLVRFFPCNDARMIVTGNKFGNVGFWNVDSQRKNAIYLYHPHTGPISGIAFRQSCLSKIVTSCYDGFVRLMDAEKEVFDLIYSSDDGIFSLSQRPNDLTSLYLGKGRGGLSVWDERIGKPSSEWILHENRINTIDFNSQNPNIVATGSTDGMACIWDLRSLNAHNPRAVKMESHKSIDDTVSILGGPNFEDTSRIYHNNQTGRWISTFRGIWGWDDSYIFIGNMKRGIDVISPVERRVVKTLQSPHMTAIPCRFDAHPYQVGTLAGATAGGQVYLWTSV